jgi:cytochrome c peroxidase
VATSIRNVVEGRRLFDKETFGGNGRTCLTCHSEATGTVSPEDARRRFRISPLRGIRRTTPYFHDNSARTLEAVMRHYRDFFAIVTDPDGPGPEPPLIDLTDQDQADIVAFMKLL